jgi:hypothetical protein
LKNLNTVIILLILVIIVSFSGCSGTMSTGTGTEANATVQNTGSTQIPTPVPSVTVAPTPTQIPTVIATPTPTPEPIRTFRAPVMCEGQRCFVEFRVYEHQVDVEYFGGQGKLFVNAFWMGGSGKTSSYLHEPGEKITLGFDPNMKRELPEEDAFIEVYHNTESGLISGGVKYYPRTGDIKEI